MMLLRQIGFFSNYFDHIYIEEDKIYIGISYYKNSNTRIADEHGNHLYKPTEHKLEKKFFLEWMITNKELAQILVKFSGTEESFKIITAIRKLNNFIKEKQEYTGRKVETKAKVDEFLGYTVLKRQEVFFSFKRALDKTNCFVEVTFKPGDKSPMEEYMFLLIPFSDLSFIYKNGGIKKIEFDSIIKKKTYAVWQPDIDTIKELAITISHISEKHRDQIAEEINKLILT